MSKKVMGREPYKFTFQIKKNGKWIESGRITYGLTAKNNRRVRSNHNPEWVNDC